jgi:hypothetical protein
MKHIADGKQNRPEWRRGTRAGLTGKERKFQTRSQVARINLMNPRIVQGKAHGAAPLRNDQVNASTDQGKNENAFHWGSRLRINHATLSVPATSTATMIANAN